MLTRSEFSAMLAVVGVSVVWHEAKAPARTSSLKAIVAPVDKDNEPLVNAYGIGGHTIQFLSGDTAAAPVKFDRIEAGGRTHVIDTVIEQRDRTSGSLVYFICHAKG